MVKFGLKRKHEELAKKYQTEIAESERSALPASKRLESSSLCSSLITYFRFISGNGGLQFFLLKCKY